MVIAYQAHFLVLYLSGVNTKIYKNVLWTGTKKSTVPHLYFAFCEIRWIGNIKSNGSTKNFHLI